MFRLVLRIPYWKGPGADSEEKREPVSDIDTVLVDSLKALDPKWPIREADILFLSPGPRLDSQNDLAPDVPRGHFIQGGRCLVQRERAADMRLQTAVGVPSEKFLNSGSHRVGKFLYMCAENDADERVIFNKDKVCWRHRDPPTGKANDKKPPLPVHQACTLIKNVAAHRLEHDVDASFASQLLIRSRRLVVR